jgi:sarcosine oxidase
MYDAVVVGLGGVGSFALRALTHSGTRTDTEFVSNDTNTKNPKGKTYLGIERFARCHDRGSSHGYTRIYRQAYFEHANYVPWLKFSVKAFRELEVAQNVSLLHESGCIVMEPAVAQTEGDPSQISMPPYCKASYESALRHDIDVEFLDTTALKARFPQFLSDHDMVGLLEPQGAGLVRPERSIEAALRDAEEHEGVKIREHTQVLSYRQKQYHDDTEIVEVVIQRDGEDASETILTKSLLIAAGAWASTFVPSWKPYVVPKRQLQGWIDVSHTADASLYDGGKLPGWILVTPSWPVPMYGPPCDPSGDDPAHRHWLKVGLHGRDIPIADLSQNPREASEDEIQEVREAATQVFTRDVWAKNDDQKFPDLAQVTPCIYTMTPDTHFVIGSPPLLSDRLGTSPAPKSCVFAIAGLSGHGFKMTPALGQMMADFANGVDVESVWGTSFCSPFRFGI